MHLLNIALVFALFFMANILATPVPLPKRVFRPENVGMGYKGRAVGRPREFLPFPGRFGVVLDHTNTPRPDKPDKVDRVDTVDSVDDVDSD